MTAWRKLLAGWRFRSAYPSFKEGERITAYATGYDEEADEGLVRIGDSLLRVEDLGPEQVDARVSLRVIAFDPGTSTGRARLESTGND